MSIFFDSSTLISLAMTCNIHWLKDLKKDYGGEFYITPAVKSETIDRGLNSLRFRYEALRLKSLVDSGVLKLYNADVSSETNNLLYLINNSFYAQNRPMQVVQLGEMTALAGALKEDADVIAVDERTTRLVVENPSALQDLFTAKLHTNIQTNKSNLQKWEKLVSEKFMILRSTELALAAWKKGLLVDESKNAIIGILWALKFAGCAISESEINIYAGGNF
ncbi:MAG: hypothetical protein V1839_00035 [archaeon]